MDLGSRYRFVLVVVAAWLIVGTLGPALAATQLPFDAEAIPFVANAERARIEADFDRAVADAANKIYTLAVSPSGAWSSIYRKDFTQADRIRNALQKCEHYSKGACLLVVVDGFMTRETEAWPRQLTYATRFALETIPFIGDEARDRLARDYDGQPGHLALAITRFGGYGFSFGAATKEEAIDTALGFCRGEQNRRGCFLYEVDANIAFNASTDISNEANP